MDFGILPARPVLLPSRPHLPLQVFSYDPPNSRPDAPLVYFVGGMVAPMGGWKGVIDRLAGKYRLLTFDRYGKGQSLASRINEPHDVLDLARYTGELLDIHLGKRDSVVPVVFVANSIGVPIVRLLAQRGLPAQTRFAAFLMVDSMVASTDFVSVLPAATEGEDPQLTAAREGVRRVFHPTAGNPEGLDRSEMPQLLPYPDKPALPDEPYLTVLAQDHELSAVDAGRICPGMTADLYLNYVAPFWRTYNAGLLKLTAPSKVKGPITVPKSNHFIQFTRPDVVASELEELMQRATLQ